MGIFRDFATSDFGTFTASFLDEADRVAAEHAKRNEVIASNALAKELASFQETENAFKNRKEITNIIVNNADVFGIIPGELTVEQIADRLVGKAFNNQRSIFEQDDFEKVKNRFANWMARNPGREFELTSPYVASEDLFNREKEVHSQRLSVLSKTPKADKLLHELSTAEAKVESPEVITDKLTKVASLSAQAYGILKTFPSSMEGQLNLQFMKTNLIVANARTQFPNDVNARMDFINKKLYDNNIDPMRAINFQNPVTFTQITKILDQTSVETASRMFELTNQLNQAQTDEERRIIQGNIDQLIMDQYARINKYSATSPMILAGKDRNLVYGTKKPSQEPKVAPPVEEEKKKGILEKIGEIIPSGDFDKKFAIEQSKKQKIKQDEKNKQPEIQEEISEADAMSEDASNIPFDSISPYAADFKLNTLDDAYVVDQWSTKYQGEGKFKDKARARNDLLFASIEVPEEAQLQITAAANVFDGQAGFTSQNIAELLSAIGYFESKYKYKKQGLNTIDDGKGTARSYWQVEPATAEDILRENMKNIGKNPILGRRFETLFKNKYIKQRAGRSALEFFASLNRKQLSELLLNDGQFAATMAAHKIVTTFDPIKANKTLTA